MVRARHRRATLKRDRLTRRRNDAFHERQAGIVRMPEHHDVANFRIVQLIREFVHDQAILVMQRRLHAAAFHPRHLESEGHDKRGGASRSDIARLVMRQAVRLVS